MTKRRMNALIIAGIFLLYIICTGVAYSSCRAYVDSNFQNTFKNCESFINSYLFGDDIDITIDDIAVEVSSNLGYVYPYAFAIYDENCNLIAKSGEYIVFNDKYINIEEYITDEILTEIKDNYEQSYAVTYKMKYNVINKEIVPTVISLVDPNDNKTLDLKLNDSVSKEYTAIGSEITALDDYNEEELCYLYSNLHTAYLSNTNKNLWNELQREIVDKEYIQEIMDSISSDSGGGTYGPDYLEYTYGFSINGCHYALELKISHNGFYDTITSAQFKSEMFTQTALFLLVLAAVLIISNKLYNKNEKLNEAKTAFISAAAHELKTPLAVIENQCECIIENVMPEKNNEYIKSIYDESLRMNKLVATLLQYNRLATSEKIVKSECSLSEIVSDELLRYMPLINDKNIKIDEDIYENVYVHANSDLISLVVDNFLSNAVKYTQEGHRIEVKLSADGIFSVFNEGKGVKTEYKDRIWNVFDCSYDDSADNSTGMGLAICRQILMLHKYKYGFENKNNGVVFYFNVK